MNIILNSAFLIYEVLQVKIEGIKSYLSQIGNWFDIFRIISIYGTLIAAYYERPYIEYYVPFMFVVCYIKTLNYLACFESIRHFV